MRIRSSTTLVTIAISFACSGSLRADNAAVRLAMSKEIIEAVGFSDFLKNQSSVILAMAKAKVLADSPRFADKIDDVLRYLKPRTDYQVASLTEQFAQDFSNKMSADELRQVAAFWKSAAGVKFRSVQSEIKRTNISVMKESMKKLVDDTANEIRVELEKRQK